MRFVKRVTDTIGIIVVVAFELCFAPIELCFIAMGLCFFAILALPIVLFIVIWDKIINNTSVV